MYSSNESCSSDGKRWHILLSGIVRFIPDNSTSLLENKCDSYLLFHFETNLGIGTRSFLYVLGLAYCFIGLSAITACFFRSMENVVKQTREIVYVDPGTGAKRVRRERIWNYTLADISLLALGTSFPQISLSTIDAFQNLGQRYAGGLGPATLVGSAAFDLYPIHAICVVVPRAGTVKKISDLGVWLVELTWSFWAYVWLYIIIEVWTPNVVTIWEAGLTITQFGLLMLHAYGQDKGWRCVAIPLPRQERPAAWVPVDTTYGYSQDGNHENYSDSALSDCMPSDSAVDIFSIHNDSISEEVPGRENVEPSFLPWDPDDIIETERKDMFLVWRQQFHNALTLEDRKTRKNSKAQLRVMRIVWQLIILPWRFLFAFVPPSDIAHGWVAFSFSLIFITGISYVVTKLTDLISCVTGVNPYIIAFTALASGTSWPDLVASKIAAERQETADSAIANITCSNSANLFVGIGLPWFINTVYNSIAFGEPLEVKAGELSFSLIVFFITFVLCMAAIVLRRYFFGGELGGPRNWAWITCFYLMFLWVVFVVLSSLKVLNII